MDTGQIWLNNIYDEMIQKVVLANGSTQIDKNIAREMFCE